MKKNRFYNRKLYIKFKNKLKKKPPNWRLFILYLKVVNTF